jgi:chromosome segregation ATPase
VPGTYTVKLTVGDKTESQTFVLKNDPRSTASQKDLEEQFALQLKIRDAVSAANNGVRTIRSVRAQAAARLASAGPNATELRRRVSALGARLNSVERELYSVQNRAGQDMLNYPIKLNDQLGSLYNTVSSAVGKPTAQSYEVFKGLNAQLQKQIAAMDRALGANLAAVNSELARLKMPAIIP